ncbi:hypothetical protein EGW08_010728, partial [Elysia chlorotica]
LSFFPYQRVRDKSTAQILIVFMAIIDLLTCMIIIPMTAYLEYTEYRLRSDIMCKMYHFLITSKVPLSLFIMVVIAIDRYLCICRPMHKVITRARVKVIIVSLTLTACTLGAFSATFHGLYQAFQTLDLGAIDQEAGTNFSDLPKLPPIWINVGVCDPSFVYLGERVFYRYQTAYNCIFPMCLLVVSFLYMLIYRFMWLRRERKLRQKLILGLDLFEDDNSSRSEVACCRQSSHSHSKQKYQWHKKRDSMRRYKGRGRGMNGESRTGSDKSVRSDRSERGSRRRNPLAVEADRLSKENRKANVRTAMMLFTVTLMFIVAYTPGWLMSMRIVPYNKLVFFLYFSYNAANPFIYAFMNHVFKSFMYKMFA